MTKSKIEETEWCSNCFSPIAKDYCAACKIDYNSAGKEIIREQNAVRKITSVIPAYQRKGIPTRKECDRIKTGKSKSTTWLFKK